ncbi:hypothetical protein CMV_028801 [Castanea mollissima]|uniref:Uncharacterized protein n=1 Tax=Castanea mollissima TaxID=60419 RepID=A0A8J4VBN8_9ROSI|nr:hypothetical protein CMV_028801 [Castanea mollissima]
MTNGADIPSILLICVPCCHKVAYLCSYRFILFGDGHKNSSFSELINKITTNVFDADVGDIVFVTVIFSLSIMFFALRKTVSTLGLIVIIISIFVVCIINSRLYCQPDINSHSATASPPPNQGKWYRGHSTVDVSSLFSWLHEGRK